MQTNLTYQASLLHYKKAQKTSNNHTEGSPPLTHLINDIRIRIRGSLKYSIPRLKSQNQHLTIRGISMQKEDSNPKLNLSQNAIAPTISNLLTRKIPLKISQDPVILSSTHEERQITDNLEHPEYPTDKEIFLKPKQSKMPKIYIKKNPRAVLLQSPIRSTLLEDDYHYSNMLINPNFTSFYDLLQVHLDIFSYFPYCSRLCLDTPNPKLLPTPPKPLKSHCSKLEYPKPSPSLCPKPKTGNLLLEIDQIRKVIPYFYSVHTSKHRASCNNNLIILNFEALKHPQFLQLRPSISKVLQKLSPHFQLILTITPAVCLSDITKLFKLEEIKLSAIYSLNANKLTSRSKTQRLADYSQIYVDFQCKLPSRQCFIVTNHCIWDTDEVSAKDFIGHQIGNSIKLNTEHIAVRSKEFPDTPLHVVVNNNSIPEDFKLFTTISKQIISRLAQDYKHKDFFDFHDILVDQPCKLISSNLPHKFLANLVEKTLSLPISALRPTNLTTSGSESQRKPTFLINP